ncbi:MAG: glycoside hydrolase family 88 protein [Clostridia bacterium]|nr:glycoside hydrolase family 88 protein [Clostridia bacterium]
MRNNIDEVIAKVSEKLRRTVPMAAVSHNLPYASKDGQWVESPWNLGNSWWTAGFWPGMMWLLNALSPDDVFHNEAVRATELMTEEFRVYRHLNHDVGFMYLLSCGAKHKIDGDEQSKWDTLHAASLLMGRFNPTSTPRAGFIKSWDGREQLGYAIIDCMMNLPLLFRATRETGDPRFAAVARIHADTAARHFVREDGSCRHIVEFDPETGAFVREHGGQGYGEGSSWSRGQAWALYGFTLLAMNTGEARDLATAEKIARYFAANIREDGLTDCDFRQPKDVYRLDNIAGACACCGFLELARLTGKEEYQQAAEKLLDGLIDHCVDYGDTYCGLLTHCTAAYHDDNVGTHTNITYGDYFFVEALCKMKGVDPMLWI